MEIKSSDDAVPMGIPLGTERVVEPSVAQQLDAARVTKKPEKPKETLESPVVGVRLFQLLWGPKDQLPRSTL